MNKENVFYINLDHRTDRREHVERELSELGWDFTRFNAVKLPNNPALGCTLSHLKILEHAKSNKLDYVVIVEDDICFTNKPQFLENLNKTLASGKHFDVCILSGNLLPPYKPFVNDCAIQVSHSQTTTGYIVKKHYYDTLINNIKTGANLLLRNPTERHNYAIDMYWIQLQQKDTWIIVIPLTVTQIDSYSDIEMRNVNYTHLMLNEKKIINGRVYLK
jgi:glycosyl transferase family 25